MINRSAQVHKKSRPPKPTAQDIVPANREHLLLELLASIGELDLLQPAGQDALLAQLCPLFRAEGAGLLFLQGQSARLRLMHCNESTSIQMDDLRLDWKQGIVERAMREKSLLTPKLTQDDSVLSHWIEAFGSGSSTSDPSMFSSGTLASSTLASSALASSTLMVAPLIVDELAYGAILVASKPDTPYSSPDQSLLAITARAISSILRAQDSLMVLETANAALEINRGQLLHSRNVLRALFDSFPDGLYIIDQEYLLTAINMQRATRIGRHPNALVGHKCYEALYDRDSPCAGCQVSFTLTAGDSTNRARREKRADGENQEWEIYTYPIYDSNEQVVQAILLEQDVTEKRILEMTLAQSEKMAAMGQWATSLAHEINNPLTAIIANSQLLMREIPAEDDRHELVDLISRAGERANQVVRSMLDLARKDEFAFGPTDVNQTIRRSLSFIQHEFVVRAVSLAFEPAEALPTINASPDHLQGVWLNLLTNALDSIESEPGEIQVKTYDNQGEVYVIVADNGKGISAEGLERIFDPFYTTKAPGHGTGLGLSVCQRIIKQHGGRILVESQPGAGSVFTVILPAA